ncbi:MAG: methyl-accepting chemotaxis protein [Thermodesulfovibrionales bacterium]
MKISFANLKLTSKLLVAPAAVIFFMLVLGLVSCFSLLNQKLAIEDIFGTRFKSYAVSADVVETVGNVHANIYKVISWANANYDAKKIDQLGKDQMTELERITATLQKASQIKGLADAEKTLYQSVLGQLEDYKKGAFSAIDLASSDLNMATMFMETADTKYQALAKGLSDLMDLENNLMEEKRNSSLKSFNTAMVIFFAVLIVSLGISIPVTLVITRLISAPIKEVIHVTGRIAEGDLTQSIIAASTDEIGVLASTTASMAGKLKAVITETKSASENLASASQELSASSGHMARGMGEQSQRAAQIANSSEEMSQTVIDVARHSSAMAGSADETARIAREGEMIVNKSVEEVKAIAETVNESSRLISSLGERSQQIGDIINVIKDIADQTNLLALNAAIEAARAGEQGRGFAVVADEVRKLAERTTKATAEIGGMIKAIQDEVQSTVRNMQNGTKRVETGVELVNSAGTALQSIVKSVEGLREMVQQIAAATEEMSTVSEQISGDIESIANVSRDTSTSSEHISSSAADLAKLSANLQTLVGQFRV